MDYIYIFCFGIRTIRLAIPMQLLLWEGYPLQNLKTSAPCFGCHGLFMQHVHCSGVQYRGHAYSRVETGESKEKWAEAGSLQWGHTFSGVETAAHRPLSVVESHFRAPLLPALRDSSRKTALHPDLGTRAELLGAGPVYPNGSGAGRDRLALRMAFLCINPSCGSDRAHGNIWTPEVSREAGFDVGALVP